MEANEMVGKVIQDYKISKPLGQGKFSIVYKAERQKDQKQVALKIVKIFDMMDNKQREKCLQEVKLLQSFDHPNIIKYLDSFILENELYIAIEWADKGDLSRYIKRCTIESEKIECEKIIEYIRQLASALQHMHEKRIIHRDLKPANILIFGDGSLKLGDLGLGRYMSDETCKAFSKVGTPLYMSPEVIRDGGYDFKSDIWSLGCVIYELMVFKSPFRADDKISLFELFNKINNGQYQKIIDEKYPIELRTLVDRMLRINPEERISIEELLKICTQIYNVIEESRPKYDPFIIMDDIMEKLNLINFDVHFCKKYKKQKISRVYFACPSVGNVYATNNPNSLDNFAQFTTFLEISYWLLHLIKEKFKYNDLQNPNFTFNYTLKEIDKKRKPELYAKEIHEFVKSYNFHDKPSLTFVSRINTVSLVSGWGESVCLLVSLLLNIFLLNENFMFEKPNFENLNDADIVDNFQEVELVEEKIDQPFDNKSKNNNFNIIPNGDINEDDYIIRNQKIPIKDGKSSAISHKSDMNSALSTQTDHFRMDPNHCIIEPSVDATEWRKECDKVSKLLVIPENVEYIYNSQSEENLKSFLNFDEINSDYYNRGRNFSQISQYFDKTVNSKELSNCVNIGISLQNKINVIDRFEANLTNSLGKKLSGFNQKTLIKTDYEKKIEEITVNCQKMLKFLYEIELRIEKRNKKYDKLKNKNYNTELDKMKKSIDILKKDCKNLDLKIGIIGHSVSQFHKSDKIKHDKKNPFGVEEFIDEYL